MVLGGVHPLNQRFWLREVNLIQISHYITITYICQEYGKNLDVENSYEYINLAKIRAFSLNYQNGISNNKKINYGSYVKRVKFDMFDISCWKTRSYHLTATVLMAILNTKTSETLNKYFALKFSWTYYKQTYLEREVQKWTVFKTKE